MINMNDLLSQIILARRNDDVESLMNILFVVVLAAFWLIGGIIKAKANKSGARNEQSPRKPTRRPPVHSKEAREKMLSRLQRPVSSTKDQRQQPRPATQKPRMKFADLQAAVRKFAVEAEKSFQADTNQQTAPEHKPILAEPTIKADSEEFTEPMDKTAKRFQETSDAAQSFETEYLSELLMDYSDPDQLRRAILHYEILGKPLSLRDPSTNVIGL
jgi:hypothetical protein